jgi:hypothetical protein
MQIITCIAFKLIKLIKLLQIFSKIIFLYALVHAISFSSIFFQQKFPTILNKINKQVVNEESVYAECFFPILFKQYEVAVYTSLLTILFTKC